MSETEIKACPSCGKAAEIIKTWSPRYSKAFYAVGCKTAGCVGNYMDRPASAEIIDAVSRWNKGAGDREPATTKTPSDSTLVPAQCCAARVALEELFLSSSLLRTRIHTHGAVLMNFEDYKRHTLAMLKAEKVLNQKLHNADISHSRD